MKKQSFISRLRSIDRATDKLETSASAEDVTYLIEHLAFTAFLLVHGGHFSDSPQKTALAKALQRAERAANLLRVETYQVGA